MESAVLGDRTFLNVQISMSTLYPVAATSYTVLLTGNVANVTEGLNLNFYINNSVWLMTTALDSTGLEGSNSIAFSFNPRDLYPATSTHLFLLDQRGIHLAKLSGTNPAACSP